MDNALLVRRVERVSNLNVNDFLLGFVRLSPVQAGVHSLRTDRQSWFQVVRLTARKRMRAALTAIRATLMRRRHEPVAVVGAWVSRVEQGHFSAQPELSQNRRKNLQPGLVNVCKIRLMSPSGF